MGAKRIVKHSVDGGIIEHEKGGLGGSRHLLNISYGKRTAQILMDIGGNQIGEHSMDTFDPLRNIKANTLDCVIVSHVHQDHNGDLVHLPKGGYSKDVIMTAISRQLTDIITRDNLKSQSEEKSAVNKRLKDEWDLIRKAIYTIQMDLGIGKTRGKKPNTHHTMSLMRAKAIVEKHKIDVTKIKNEEHLKEFKPEFKTREFNEHDIKVMLEQIKTIPYNQEHTVVKDFVRAKFYDAGHVEGSAQILLKIMGNHHQPKNTMNLLYTGDLGRTKQPGKAGEPEIPKERIDYLIIEGTYGDKNHLDREKQKKAFIKQLNSANGLVLIPSFAIQRFQENMDVIGEAMRNRSLHLHSGEQIYCHSNLAYEISKEYLLHDTENKYPHLRNHRMKWLTDQSEIQGIMHGKGRKIIICSGGMLENGSIMQYLHHATQSSNAQIVTTGFQAPGTIGDRLTRNDFSIPIVVNDKEISSNKAKITGFSFSAHADQEELISYISQLKLAKHAQISIVHGGNQRFALAHKITELLQARDLHKKSTDRGLRKINVPTKNGTEITVQEPVNMNY